MAARQQLGGGGGAFARRRRRRGAHFFLLYDVRTRTPVEIARTALPSLQTIDEPSEQVLRRLAGDRVSRRALGRAWGDGLWFVLQGAGAGGTQLALLHWNGREVHVRLLDGASPRLTDLDRDTSPELLYVRSDGVRALLQWDGDELVEWDVDGVAPRSESTQRLLREARRLGGP